MIKVLVVDDHDLIRSGISRMLNDDVSIEVVGDASSGEEAIEFVRQIPLDVILMDLKMPGIGGLEATRRISKTNEEIKIVVVSSVVEDPYASRVIDAGAAAYVSKNSHVSEIIKAIKKAVLGQRYLSGDVAQAMALNERSPFDNLSERELQIAMMIIECQKVQSISDALCLSPKTVNSYRYRVFEKLDITSDVELALLAVRHGLIEVHND